MKRYIRSSADLYDMPTDVKIKLLEFNAAEPQVLRELAEDDNWDVRCRVAKLTDDRDILIKLANDPDEDVRGAVAARCLDKKLHMPKEVCEKLRNDPSEYVRDMWGTSLELR